MDPTEPAVSIECDRCGVSFSYTPILIDGKEIAKRKRCESCVAMDRSEIERASRLQNNYDARLAAQDRDNSMAAILDRVGANPWEHADSTLDNFDVGEATYKPVNDSMAFAFAVAAAGKYDPVRGLYFWGETGCGKSHLAVGIIREIVRADFSPQRILFDNAAELISRIHDTYGRKETSTFDLLEERFDAGLWILDDLGTERASDDVARHLTLIFTRRALRPTLITSNLSPETLQEERPEFFRILSRLGPKYFRVCEVRGRDRRFG